jgi:hypothetical protein
VRGGVVGPALAVGTDAQAIALGVVPAAGGGGTVTWTDLGEGLFQSSVDAGGVPTAARAVSEPLPWLVDGGGDLALADLDELDPQPRDLAVQPADGGPAARAPARDGRIAVAPFGRAFALLTRRAGQRFSRYAIWRP